jgi:hypothetical protein
VTCSSAWPFRPPELNRVFQTRRPPTESAELVLGALCRRLKEARMRWFLLRAVLIIALAFTLLVCALYPRLIPWMLLGLYLMLAVRGWRRRRVQAAHARALAQTEAAEDEAYRRWRRQRGLAQMAADGPSGEVQPTALSSHAQHGPISPRVHSVPRARRWH